jgi:RNA recognition motif-containing protein
MGTAPPPLFQGSDHLKKIYVGNLSFSNDDQDLAAIFSPHGEVASAKVVLDRETGRSRGFGFVEMSDDNAAMQAIQAVNGQEIDGRTLTVNEARPREPRNNSRW